MSFMEKFTDKELAFMEKCFLVLMISCAVGIVLGLYAIFNIMAQNSGCHATRGLLVNYTHHNETVSEFMKIEGTLRNVEYNIELNILQDNITSTHYLNQNITKEYLEYRYPKNKTYLVNMCEGVVGGLINDNRFNRWLTG